MINNYTYIQGMNLMAKYLVDKTPEQFNFEDEVVTIVSEREYFMGPSEFSVFNA